MFKAPKVKVPTPATPPPPPTVDEAAVRAEEEMRLRRRRGRAAYVMAGKSAGMMAPPVATKSLTGQ